MFSSHLSVVERESLQTSLVIRNLRDGRIFLSSDEKFLGCLRPVGNSSEIIVYSVDDIGTVIIKVPVKGCISDINPLFTLDNKYIIVCTNSKPESVWAIKLDDGTSRIIYQCDDGYMINALDINSSGLLISVFRRVLDGCFGHIVCYRSLNVVPYIIRFSNVEEHLDMLDHEKLNFQARWVNKEDMLLTYNSNNYKTHIQIIEGTLPESIIPQSNYTIPCFINGSLVISSNGTYLAYNGMRLNSSEHRMESIVSVYHIQKGIEVFTEKQKYIYDIQFGGKPNCLLISGEVSKIVSIM